MLSNVCFYRNNFKEKNAKEIELPGKQFDDVLEMLLVLHPPNKEICGKKSVYHNAIYYCSYSALSSVLP